MNGSHCVCAFGLPVAVLKTDSLSAWWPLQANTQYTTANFISIRPLGDFFINASNEAQTNFIFIGPLGFQIVFASFLAFIQNRLNTKSFFARCFT